MMFTVDNFNALVLNPTKGYTYLAISRDIEDKGDTSVYIVKQTGERSWVALEIGGVNSSYNMITGNRTNIFDNVEEFEGDNRDVRFYECGNKIELRQAIMEAMLNRTVAEIQFEIRM